MKIKNCYTNKIISQTTENTKVSMEDLKENQRKVFVDRLLVALQMI